MLNENVIISPSSSFKLKKPLAKYLKAHVSSHFNSEMTKGLDNCMKWFYILLLSDY